MDPNISKATTGKERVVAECAESQSTLRGPNRTRFLAVQAAIRAKQCVKQSFRVSYQPLNLGGVEGGSGPAAQPKFFFQLLSSDQFSYRI